MGHPPPLQANCPCSSAHTIEKQSPLFYFETIFPRPITKDAAEESVPVFHITAFRYRKAAVRYPQSPILSACTHRKGVPSFRSF